MFRLIFLLLIAGGGPDATTEYMVRVPFETLAECEHRGEMGLRIGRIVVREDDGETVVVQATGYRCEEELGA